METVFSLSSFLVMPFWALMVFLPTWSWTQRIITSPWVAAPSAALYVLLVLPSVLEVLPAVLNPNLSAIAVLLGTPAGATLAWVHFLAFDLFVGRWVYLDARERGLSPWLTSPVLFLVLMLGPLGFLLYLTLRVSLRSQPASARVAPE